MLRRSIPIGSIAAVRLSGGCTPAIPTIDPGPQDSAAPAPSDLCEWVGMEALSSFFNVSAKPGDPAATPKEVIELARTMPAKL